MEKIDTQGFGADTNNAFPDHHKLRLRWTTFNRLYVPLERKIERKPWLERRTNFHRNKF